tara:strand:- start:1200 stop:1505 length:306 start_codon:yes stop_codon:yes gene_type:complete
MTDYLAVSRGGDLPGMAGHEVSMPIHNKEQLRLWRNFNKCSEIFHSAHILAAVQEAPMCGNLQQAALDAHFATAQELAKSYGEEWSKWHTRTSWVVKRNGR